MSSVRCFTPEHAEREITQLADLLMDSVDSGASGGFMSPLGQAEALAYCGTGIATVPLDEVLATMNYGGRSTA